MQFQHYLLDINQLLLEWFCKIEHLIMQKPIMDNCLLWSRYIFPEGQYSSLQNQTKLYNDHRMLCEKHFRDADFKDITKAKLLRTAVPCDSVAESCADAGDSGLVEEPGVDDTDICGDDDGDSDTLVESNSVAESCADAGDSGLVEEPGVDDTDICDDNDDDSETLVESNVCRVCLALDVKMYDLKDIELREMFQNITGIVVSENDHSLLERLCWECAGRLKAAVAFRNKALLSDALLKCLANTGEQIRKIDVTLIKENQDYLKSAGTLSLVEVFRSVDIDAEYESVPSMSENNDTDIVQKTVRKDSIELKQSIIKENNDQMVVEDESMIGTPINTGGKNRNIVLEAYPTFSNNIPLRDKTSNSAYSSPPPGCSHAETNNPIVSYIIPSDCENKVKKTVVKITKRESISKILSKKSKEVINHDQKFKRPAKLKNINLKVYGNSKKTLNQKLVKETQDKTNTSTDEEYTDVEYLNFENFEF